MAFPRGKAAEAKRRGERAAPKRKSAAKWAAPWESSKSGPAQARRRLLDEGHPRPRAAAGEGRTKMRSLNKGMANILGTNDRDFKAAKVPPAD
jgi:hypothetical protein